MWLHPGRCAVQKTMWQRITTRLAGSKHSFPMAVINNAPASGAQSKQAELLLSNSAPGPSNSFQAGVGSREARPPKQGGMAASKRKPSEDNETHAAGLLAAMWSRQDEVGSHPQTAGHAVPGDSHGARAGHSIGHRWSMERQPAVRLNSAAEQRMCEYCLPPASCVFLVACLLLGSVPQWQYEESEAMGSSHILTSVWICLSTRIVQLELIYCSF